MTTAKGFNGSIDFDGKLVTVRKKLSTAAQIPVSRVQSVEYKAGGLMIGHLRVVVAGAVQGEGRNKTQATLRDANTVTFHKGANIEFRELADAILAAM